MRAAALRTAAQHAKVSMPQTRPDMQVSICSASQLIKKASANFEVHVWMKQSTTAACCSRGARQSQPSFRFVDEISARMKATLLDQPSNEGLSMQDLRSG